MHVHRVQEVSLPFSPSPAVIGQHSVPASAIREEDESQLVSSEGAGGGGERPAYLRGLL